MTQKVFFLFLFFQFIMDGESKNPLRIAVIEFYKLNSKNIHSNTSKKVLLGQQSIDGLKSLKPLEIAIENLVWPSERTSSCRKLKWTTKHFEVLKNELYKLFVTQSCQKIEYDALFIMIFIPVSNFGDQSLVSLSYTIQTT